MNRVTVMLLCLILCLVGTAMPSDAKVSAADTVPNVVIAMTIGSKILDVDGVDREIDADPEIKWDRTFSPVAPIISALGGTIEWNNRTRGVTIVLGTETIGLTIGDRHALLNGKSVSIDTNPDLVPYVRAPGRTMLPIRFIAEHFGGLVTWNSTLKRVTLAWKVTSLSVPPTQRVVSFAPSQTVATFLALLGDMSIDVIELNGTYHLPKVFIDIDRTRPIMVRPAAGATVVFSGASLGGSGQFHFGDNDAAGDITMQGFIFDGFTLGQIGIIGVLDAHNITLNDMVVRNSRDNGTTAQPRHAWALYLSSTAATHPTNITANRWTVDGSARGMSALQVYGGSHVTATGWSVAHACYAVYASDERGPLTDFVLDDWTISDTCCTTLGTDGESVHFQNVSGRFSNMHATTSGRLINMGITRMSDAGGNTLVVLPLGRSSSHAVRQT